MMLVAARCKTREQLGSLREQIRKSVSVFLKLTDRVPQELDTLLFLKKKKKKARIRKNDVKLLRTNRLSEAENIG